MNAAALIATGVPASFFRAGRQRWHRLIRRNVPDTATGRAFVQGRRDGRANRHAVSHMYARPELWIEWLRGWREGQRELRESAR